jgi:hypothetical protein
MLVPKTEKDEEEELRRRESRYIKMVKAIFKVCKRQNIPLYSSRYSRRDFTLWQHIALMQRIRKSYREYTYDFLTVADKLLEAIGLAKIPHFTTIEKFMLRVPSMLLERVIGGFILLTRVNKEAVICSRLIRIFIAPCLYILCLEDKERCLIIDEEAGEVEGVDWMNE